MTNALSFFWIYHGIFMTKSSDQRGENERYINRSLSLDGIGEAGCILKYAEAYTIAPSHIARWLSPGIYCRSWLHTATHSSPRHRRHRTVGPNRKTLSKIWFKNSWNWLIILVPATIWQVLNMKCTLWPETEVMWICRNFFWKNSWNHFGQTYFRRVLTSYNHRRAAAPSTFVVHCIWTLPSLISHLTLMREVYGTTYYIRTYACLVGIL